eukprot:821915_1
MSMWQRIEQNDASFISKYLLQFVSPIVSEMYWTQKEDKKRAIELIFENKHLLEQTEFVDTLKAIHCFNYWAKLNKIYTFGTAPLNAVDVLQHTDLYPFYFGCCSLVNGLFEHNLGQLNCAKRAFYEIPKEKVQTIYDQINRSEMDKEKQDLMIFNYIQRLMQQMFHDTLNKIAKIAWGNIAIYQFDKAKEIAHQMLQFDQDNVTAFGVLCRTSTEEQDYKEAIAIFEENITEEKCASDALLYFNMMPYYAISLCLSDAGERKEEGNQIMMRLLQKVNKDEGDEIHIIHKEQVYRWYAYKLQYLDHDYANAITFYEKSFLQEDKTKYPPIQIEIAKCYLQTNQIEEAKQNIEEASQNGRHIFGDNFIDNQYDQIMNQIQLIAHATTDKPS